MPWGWDGRRGEGPPAGRGRDVRAGCGLTEGIQAQKGRRGGGEGVALSLWEKDRVTQSPGGVRGLLESRAGISGLPREG